MWYNRLKEKTMGSDSLFTEPGRSHIVSSARMRKFQEYTNAQFGLIYHRILGLLGDTRTLVVCNTMTNLAFLRLLGEVASTNEVIINPFTATALVPSSATQAQRATCDREVGYISAGIVGSQQLFVMGSSLDPRVKLTRSSEISKESASNVWAILENDISYALVDEVPYLARFAVLSDPGVIDLTLTVAFTGASFTCNAVKIIPVPIAGGVTIADVTHTAGLSLYGNNHTLITAATEIDDERSFAAFIPFEPVKTTSMSITFLSSLYSSVLKCTSVGIGLMSFYHNIYARKSYIGFYIEPPEGATRIAQVTTKATPFTPDLSGVQYYFYPDRNSFDLISNEFVAVTGPNQYANIPAAPYYLLVEIASTNNTTPVIKSIKLSYE